MDSFATVILLGLLTLGHATVLPTVTQFPQTNDDFLQEAATDGFLVDQRLLTSQTTQAPTIFKDEEGTMVHNSTTGEEGAKGEESATTKESIDATDLFSSMSGSGSGEEEEESHTTTTSPTSTTSISTTSTISTNTTIIQAYVRGRGLGLGSGIDLPNEEEVNSLTVRGSHNVENFTTMHKGHVTPDWIIILGFLVGVAVLVLLCVAIATRDKWNRSTQFNSTGITIEPADQQKAGEMETFLHSEQPKENGKSEEYTVIPLDELPHSYSS